MSGFFILCVRVVPNASKTAVAGRVGDAIKIKVAAVPEDGKANAALLDFLAETLGVSKRDVALISGETSRSKRVVISGLDEATVAKRLGL